jgi:hypothetical protein
LLGYALLVTIRIRWKARRLPVETASFFITSSNALIASQVAFLIGGAFAAEALNEVNWFVFALVAALDRLYRDAHAAAQSPDACAQREVAQQPVRWRPAAAAWRTRHSLIALGRVAPSVTARR